MKKRNQEKCLFSKCWCAGLSDLKIFSTGNLIPTTGMEIDYIFLQDFAFNEASLGLSNKACLLFFQTSLLHLFNI